MEKISTDSPRRLESGVSCLSRCVVEDRIAAKRLLVLPTPLPRLTRRFALIHHRKKLPSAALQLFVAECQALNHEARLRFENGATRGNAKRALTLLERLRDA